MIEGKDNEICAVAAPTGTASFAVDGQTLHSLLALPIYEEKNGPPPRLKPLYGPPTVYILVMHIVHFC